MKFTVLNLAIALIGISNAFAEDTDCEACSLSQINIIPGDDVESITPTVATVTTGADGCLRTSVSCDVRGIPNAITYMTVNSFSKLID